jgi:polyisoprenoid-binding protein YceI
MNPKHLLAPALVLTLGIAACVGGTQGPGSGAWKLDSGRSTLTATAIKNESKAVPVHFPGLKGWADPSSGKARLEIPLTTLSTGDLARDANVRTLFFEVDKLASYGSAVFSLEKADADLSMVKEGAPIETQGHGTLELHGAKLGLDGPLAVAREGQSIRVTLGKAWVVEIDKTSLVQALANLNKNCPQPHRVANDVALSGDLVFVP